MTKKDSKLRDREFHFRLSESELNDMKRRASDAGMSASDYLRWSISGKEITTRVIVDDESGPLSKIRFQLEKLGNNLNQITRLLNSGFINPESFRTEISGICKEIHNAILNINKNELIHDAELDEDLLKSGRYGELSSSNGT